MQDKNAMIEAMLADFERVAAQQQADTQPGYYYVTAQLSDGRRTLLLGPYRNDHQSAIFSVASAAAIMISLNEEAINLGYGTARFNEHRGQGELNKYIN